MTCIIALKRERERVLFLHLSATRFNETGGGFRGFADREREREREERERKRERERGEREERERVASIIVVPSGRRIHLPH